MVFGFPISSIIVNEKMFAFSGFSLIKARVSKSEFDLRSEAYLTDDHDTGQRSGKPFLLSPSLNYDPCNF